VGVSLGLLLGFWIHDWNVIRHAGCRGDIALGEYFIDSTWETDNIEDLISLFLLNLDHIEGFAHGGFLQRCGFLFRNHFVRRNTLAGAKTNIKAHYDVGNDFYRLWLDESLTYSSALFDPPALDLAAAQHRKHGRILDKFASPRCSVFEIGCGWGAFSQQAIERGHDVTAITVSPAQYNYALDRLRGAADVRLEDYRSSRGLFDMVVSIEMFEAVGNSIGAPFFTYYQNV
jgi:cyclopropane-fatty-acyl-phospholipid synthase